jgi:hypothetical protein
LYRTIDGRWRTRPPARLNRIIPRHFRLTASGLIDDKSDERTCAPANWPLGGQRRPDEPMRTLCRVLIPLSLLAAACSGTTGPRTVANPDPAVKLPLVEQAVKNNDHSVVPQLVHDLRDDDPSVRMFAIDALHKLTGQTFGYTYYEDDETRVPAEQRWDQWLAAGNR